MRGRRLKGEGSIWSRKDGKYGAATYVVRDGVRRRATVTRDTADAVIDALKRLQRGEQVARRKRGKFGEFLDEWLSEKRMSVKPKTYESYESFVRLHIKPVIGDVTLAKLEPRHITLAVKTAADKGLSTSAQAYIRTIARIALERARDLGRVAQNVAKLAPSVHVVKREFVPFNDDEFGRLMGAIIGDRLEALYELALAMGPREGEILGLQWPDIIERTVEVIVDGKPVRKVTTTVRISRQVQRVNGKLIVSDVKTDKGRRSFNVPEVVADALRRHRVRQLEERMKAGDRWKDTGHVFTSKIGTPIEPRTLLRDFHAKQAAVGIYDPDDETTLKNRRKFHALRHEAATALLVAGVDIKSIAAVLGHANERFTSETYTHLVPALEARVTEAAGVRLRRTAE